MNIGSVNRLYLPGESVHGLTNIPKGGYGSHIAGISNTIIDEIQRLASKKNLLRRTKDRRYFLDEQEESSQQSLLDHQNQNDSKKPCNVDLIDDSKYDIANMSLGLLIEILVGLFALKDLPETQKTHLLHHIDAIVRCATNCDNRLFARDTLNYFRSCIEDLAHLPTVLSEDVLYLNDLLEIPIGLEKG